MATPAITPQAPPPQPPAQPPAQPPQQAPQQSDPIEEFIGLPRDQQMSTLQQLPADKQEALLTQIRTRQQARQQQQQQPPQQSTWDRFKSWAKSEPTESTGSDVLDAIRDFGVGAGASAAEIPATAGHLVDKLLGIKTDPVTANIQKTISTAPDDMSAHAGRLFEQVGEFALGEEGLRGLTASQRLAKLTPIVKVLENNPRLARIALENPEFVRSLPGAARAAITGGAQSLAHGGTGEQALESAATAGGLGIAGGTIAGAVGSSLAPKIDAIAQRVNPDTIKVGDTEIPRFAAQREGVTPRDANVITAKERPDIPKQQQALAQQAYGEVATRATQRSLDRFGHTAEPVADFAQGAEQLRKAGDDVYNTIDDASEGRFRQINEELEDAKRIERTSTALDTLNQARAAKAQAFQKMNDLFDGYDDANYSEALRGAAQKAKAIFADHYTMNDIHDSLNKAFDVPSEETALDRGKARQLNVPGTRRADLGKQLANLEDTVGRNRLTSVLGPDGLGNLWKIADITDDPQKAEYAQNVAQEMVNEVTKRAAGGAFKGGLTTKLMGIGWTPGAKVGSVIGAGTAARDVVARRFMYYAANSPRIGDMLHYAAANNISPRYAARMIGTAMSHQLNQQAVERQQQQQEQP